MITLEQWALVRGLVAEGVPKARIAERLGISRTTVVKMAGMDSPPRYVRRAGPTSFSVFEERVRVILEEFPDMPASVIAERVGWTGSMSWFRAGVARLRPAYRTVDPADRLVWEAGDAAQCDLWFPPYKIPLEDGSRSLLPAQVITLAHSRTMLGRLIPTRMTPDLLLGMWVLLEQLGRVPRRLIWDNEAGIGRGRLREPVAMFAGMLGTRIVLLKARDPETKGIVERRNGFFETSFMPGREFTSPADFNEQFNAWLAIANTRVVRTIGVCPADRLEADLAGMSPLPPVSSGLGWNQRTMLGRDYYVRLAGNDYSVDPIAIGHYVDVSADLERVQARWGGRLVADHPRVWARGKTITDPAHVASAAKLRSAYGRPRPTTPDVGVRDLADYDKAFGLDRPETP